MSITLREITMENFRECIRLSVAEDQRGFVASNLYSLAEAKADGVSNPLAVYDGEEMVGFVMFDFAPREKRGSISRLMVDARFQRKGYGRAAMSEAIDRLKREPGIREIRTSFVPENRAADALYSSLGFIRTSEVDGGEIVVRLELAD